ncbi:very-long-chain (3R)-3-hydroxyacyl-CoA dehydratase-like protein [Dinothrombium tinctorium]|uniref:Very-long-chain (3R)-3-hydroxyacyl-CoA dehydratase n=1 Tax=Dinothrombium tinctorium TaxID=1965070 RepID=A0A3S3SDQ4_9ACAR|nr:very-long-chain (3R)-3-hydroxyacyl-CoA dehydratase-like protein [Dinothrombium tinctorium]
MKKTYLIAYNAFVFANFAFIVGKMLIEANNGRESMANIYSVIGSRIKFLFLLQFLEVLHAAIGLTKGSAIFPFIQVGVRAFILFVIIDKQPEMHRKPTVFYILLVWSLVEIFRYPYYLTSLLKFEIKVITALRYTVWIPLYPLGIFLEATVMCQNLHSFEQSMKYSISLPNAANFSFHFPTFIKIYLSVFIWFGTYFMMSHMYSQMKRTLFSNSKKRQ